MSQKRIEQSQQEGTKIHTEYLWDYDRECQIEDTMQGCPEDNVERQQCQKSRSRVISYFIMVKMEEKQSWNYVFDINVLEVEECLSDESEAKN